MKFIFCVLLLVLMSCSSNKTLPQNVKEISSSHSEKCQFVDALNMKEESVSAHQLKQQIQKLSASRGANAYVINENIKNGFQVAITGSLFHCSK